MIVTRRFGYSTTIYLESACIDRVERVCCKQCRWFFDEGRRGGVM